MSIKPRRGELFVKSTKQKEEGSSIGTIYDKTKGRSFFHGSKPLAAVESGILIIQAGRYVLNPLITIRIAALFIWSTVQEISTSGRQLLRPENAFRKHESALWAIYY